MLRLDFHWLGACCLLTRFIQSTKVACFAGGIIRPKLLCSNMAAPARTRSLRPASIPVMWRLLSAGDAVPSTGCSRLARSFWRRRLNGATEDEFSVLPEWRAEGMTDYVAIITRFAAEGVIGEMDGVYSAWATRQPEGFTDDQIATLKRIVPYLGLSIKSVSLARMIRTLMETYLGRDAGQRVLSGRIVRGIAEQIDAVVWFSDLRGFTRISDTAPEEVMSLLNDYSDVIISAIDEHGGDVLKLIGDGTLAIFRAEDRLLACNAALSAAIAAREGVVQLNKHRAAKSKPLTEMYLGLHVGNVFYGNVGSRERLDFTVLGPAVNEASRIAAMCRSVDQPILMSTAFAEVGNIRHRLVSVGRYALRGVSHPQELFTLNPEA